MKVVIQCARGKHQHAGKFMSADGRPVMFMGQPEKMPPSAKYIYARPDDDSGDGQTWREHLSIYNREKAKENPFGLLPAYLLYTHPIYGALADKFGKDKVFIMSAGWGIIAASFLIPDYNITFKAKKGEERAIRKKGDQYQDFNMLPDDGEDVFFLGAASYRQPFYDLMTGHRGKKLVSHRRASPPPDLPRGFMPAAFETRACTNWHYICARALINGEINY